MTVPVVEVPLLEYRRLVLEHTELPQVWLHPDRYAAAAGCSCAGNRPRPCPREDDCFSYALLTDDPTPYRAGVSRWERAELWHAMEAWVTGVDPQLGELGRQLHAGQAGRPGLRVV